MNDYFWGKLSRDHLWLSDLFLGKSDPSLLFSIESKRIEKMVHGVKFQCPVLLLGSLLAITLALTEEQVEMRFPLWVLKIIVV